MTSEMLSRYRKYLVESPFIFKESFENIFIVGAPRSGTTIFNQAFTYCFDVGFVDNLAARFFWNPALGVRIRQSLGYEKKWMGKSMFGQTDEISEPHEFGQFWRESLNYDDMVQKEYAPNMLSLVSDLDMISSEFGKPVVYKAFLLAWHLSYFHNKFAPNSKWIFIERNLLDNAVSVAGLRRSRGGLGDVQSMMPISAQHVAEPYEQIVRQVRGVNHWIETELDKIPDGNSIVIKYEDFVADPDCVFHKVSNFLAYEFDRSKLSEIKPSLEVGKGRASEHYSHDFQKIEKVIRSVF